MVWDYMIFVKIVLSFSRFLNGFLYMFISYVCYIDIKYVFIRINFDF